MVDGDGVVDWVALLWFDQVGLEGQQDAVVRPVGGLTQR